MTLFENYLTRLREIRSSGEVVNETSYYDALSNFFNEIGKSLRPRVHCILQLKNRGAGNPMGSSPKISLRNEKVRKPRPLKIPLAASSKSNQPKTTLGSPPRANRSAVIGENTG